MFVRVAVLGRRRQIALVSMVSGVPTSRMFVRVLVVVTGRRVVRGAVRVLVGMIGRVVVVGMFVVMPATSAVGGAIVNDEMRRRHACAQHLAGGNLAPGQRQAAERLTQVRKGQPRIEEGAEHHISADAREGIEIQHARH